MKKIKVSDYIALFLKKIGVKHVFGIAGGHLMHIMDSIVHKANIKYIASFHEQAAAMMTKAYSRASKNFGVLLVTSGPAGTNAITGVASAWMDSVPMLVISGQFRVPTLPLKVKIRSSSPQQYFPVPMIKTITKYSKLILNEKDIVKSLFKAYEKSISGRPGPVWLDIPLDIQGRYININLKKELSKINLLKKKVEKKINKNKILLIIKKIKKSQKPLILAGNGIKISRSEKLFFKFLKKVNIPTLTTLSAIDLIEEKYPLYFGRPGLYARRHSNIIIQNCDLLICFGAGLHYETTGYNLKEFAKKSKKIIIDVDKQELKKYNKKNSTLINIDLKSFFKYFNKLQKINLELPNCNNWINYCIKLKKKYSQGYLSIKKNELVNHYNFFKELSKLSKNNDKIILGNAGFHAIIGWQSFHSKSNQKIFNEIGAGCMGHSLPSSIGSSIALNNCQITCVTGDGGIQVNIQELQTIKTYNLPIKIFIMENGGYISLINTQKKYFNGRLIGANSKSGFKIPDIKKIARAYGFKFNSIYNNGELSKKIKENLNYKKSFISVVHCNHNVRLTPFIGTKLLKNGEMISEGLDKQID
jgi:acetolactate synthase-1/2/3 large subunit